VQQALRRGGEGFPHAARVGGLPAEEQVAHRREGVRHLADDLLEEGRGEEQDRNPPLAQEAREPPRGEEDTAVHPHEAGAVDQGPPDLEGRRVEGAVGHLGDPVLRGELDVVGAEHQAGDRAVGDPDPFGPARGAGGVEDVGEAIPRDHGRFRDPGPGWRLAERQNGDPPAGEASRQLRQEPLLGDHGGDGGVLHHEGEPLSRIAGIEGHVRASRGEDAEHRHPEVGGPLQAETDARFRADPEAPEAGGQPAGALRQLAVGDLEVPVLDRHPGGLAFGPAQDEPVDRGIPGVLGRRPVPAEEDLPALRLLQQGQLREPRLRAGGGPREERAVAAQEVPDGRRVEQVTAVFGPPGEVVPGAFDVQREVELGGPRVDLGKPCGEPGAEVQRSARGVL
jgi:hypothetical protein